ncbi:MAG: hypothetical protein JJT82_02030 [Legionellaceae bacterium]|nr:hypothetical protein [Legionellaceae bacterium]
MSKKLMRLLALASVAALVVAGAAALTLLLWPAALPALLSFTVLGVAPFAFAAGFSFAAQVALFSGMAAALAASATGALAAAPSLFRSIAERVRGFAKPAADSEPSPVEENQEPSKNPLSELGKGSAPSNVVPITDAKPQEPQVDNEASNEESNEESNEASNESEKDINSSNMSL